MLGNMHKTCLVQKEGGGIETQKTERGGEKGKRALQNKKRIMKKKERK